MSGWQGEPDLGFYGSGGCSVFSPVVRFSSDKGCYPDIRSPLFGIQCHCQRGQIGLAGFAEPTPTPLQQSFARIKAALDLNPKGGYVRGTPARAVLDGAIAAVPVCLAAKVFIELRFGTSPLAKLFKYRLHPRTFQEMLEMLKTKVLMCLQALKLATLRNTPAPSCTNIDTLTNSICNNGRLLCKTAGELDEIDGWNKCVSAINSCRDASQRSRDCS
jgi:hypothetical protein